MGPKGGLLSRTYGTLILVLYITTIKGQNEFGVFLGKGSSSICYDGIEPPVITSFSICTFLKMQQPAPESNVFKYAHSLGSSFTIGLTYYGVWIRVESVPVSREKKDGRYKQSKEEERESIEKSDNRYFFEVTIPPKLWRGICITYDGYTKEAKCFIDGKQESISSAKTVKTLIGNSVMKSKFLLKSESVISLPSNVSATTESKVRTKRQADRSICAGSKEFEGEMAGLQIWNIDLDDTEVMRKSNCKRAKLASAGNIINLNNEWKFYGNSSKRYYDRSKLCSSLDSSLLMKPAGSFDETKDFCIGVGGHLTEPAVINENLLKIAKDTGDYCVEWDGTISWLTHTITDPKIETKFCEALDKEGKITFITCVRRLACSLCIVPAERFTLYGHSGEYFNYVYYLFSSGTGEARWEGVRGSAVTRKNGTWTISSSEHSTVLSTEGVSLPIGRRIWTWNTELTERPMEILLTFTVCRTTEFSCDDGQCIPIILRCNDVMNCRDSSDEKNCNVIKKPKGYDVAYVPPLRPNEVLPAALGYHLDVYNLGRITTEEGRARVDLGLTMTWYDSRIEFSNLKPVQKNYFDCSIVWLPRVRAMTGHGDGSVLDVNSYEKFCYVYADDQEEVRALTDPLMGYSSPGSSYPIMYYLGILGDVPCEFDFVRYPFDVQKCNVSFMIMNAPGQRFYRKYTPSSVVPYLNEKYLLLEYKLKNITTEVGYNIRGTDNNTYFVVTLHFERLYGYHIMNSFFPSLLMGLVSYSTFFFQGFFETEDFYLGNVGMPVPMDDMDRLPTLDDFTNRIMVSLTAQLVLAALFTSTTASSVKTPYLKMIDVWYACIIAFCFLIVISQVLVDAARNKVIFDQDMDSKEAAERLIDPENIKKTKFRIKNFTQRITTRVKGDLVERVNRYLKLFLICLLAFFVIVYGAIAAGYY